jgi:hypothetical protein
MPLPHSFHYISARFMRLLMFVTFWLFLKAINLNPEHQTSIIELRQSFRILRKRAIPRELETRSPVASICPNVYTDLFGTEVLKAVTYFWM